MNHKEQPDIFGRCIACSTSTADKCSTCGTLKTNKHYKERSFKLSDNSTMKVAFCDKCSELVKEEDFEWIMKNIILGWEESLKNKDEEKKQKYRDNFYKLKIVDYL